MFLETLNTLIESTLATIYMVLVAGVCAFIIGLPIAVGLTVTGKGMFYENKIIEAFVIVVIKIHNASHKRLFRVSRLK